MWFNVMYYIAGTAVGFSTACYLCTKKYHTLRMQTIQTKQLYERLIKDLETEHGRES